MILTAAFLLAFLFQATPPDRLTELTEQLRQLTVVGDQPSARRLMPELLAELAKGHPYAAWGWLQAGVCFTAQGEYGEAERAYLRGLRQAERGSNDPRLEASLLSNLAVMYLETGRPVLAETFVRRAMIPAVKAYSAVGHELSGYYALLGAARQQRGESQAARELLGKALELADPGPGGERQRGNVLVNLAVVAAMEHHWEEARELLLRSIELQEVALGASHPELIRTHLNLGRVYEQLKRWEQARASAERAREMTERQLGAEHGLMAEILETTASILRKTGHRRESRELRRWAAAIANAQPKDSGGASVHLSELAEGGRRKR